MLNRLQHHNLGTLLWFGLLAGTSLQGNTIFSVQFEGTSGPIGYTGVEPDAVTADAAFANSKQWNHLDGSLTHWSNLVDNTGATSGASLDIPSAFGGYNDFSHGLPDTYLYSLDGVSPTFTISGLTPNESFTLFLYALNSVNSPNDRGEIFTVGSSTFVTATGHPATLDTARATDGSITGVTSSTGTISGTWAFDLRIHSREIDWSGFQLDVASPAASAPEPASMALFGAGLALVVTGGWLKRRNG